MASEQGFSNQKKKGKAQFKTIHQVNSDAYGESVIPKYLAEVQASTFIDIVAISDILGTNGQVEFWEIEFSSAHVASVGDIIRMKSVSDQSLFNFEFEIQSVISAEIIRVLPISNVKPSIGDLASVRRWVTASSDDEGNPIMSQGPVKFVLDTVPTEVSKDSSNPANTIALPVEDFETRATLVELDSKLAGSLVPLAHDEIVTTYVGATTDISTVVYKLAGSTVATLTLTYDGSNRLIGVVRS